MSCRKLSSIFLTVFIAAIRFYNSTYDIRIIIIAVSILRLHKLAGNNYYRSDLNREANDNFINQSRWTIIIIIRILAEVGRNLKWQM